MIIAIGNPFDGISCYEARYADGSERDYAQGNLPPNYPVPATWCNGAAASNLITALSLLPYPDNEF
jgi:hypothetical protein